MAGVGPKRQPPLVGGERQWDTNAGRAIIDLPVDDARDASPAIGDEGAVLYEPHTCQRTNGTRRPY
jgi:hypothetical protein